MTSIAPRPTLWDSAWSRAAVLIVVTLLVYLPALRGGFIFDDNVFLTENPLIAAPDGLMRFWFSREAADYWPLTSTTLWLEWRLWGLNATGYHATNLALHVGTVLLLWRVLARLRVPGAFLGALIFAVHPLNAESVVWITQRKNLLALFFFLLALFWFLQVPERRRAYALSLGAFVLGLLSKSSVVVLPVVLLGVVAWQRRPTRRDWLRLLPFFAVAALLVSVQMTFSTLAEPITAQPEAVLVRTLRAAGALWFYLGRILWPANLSFDYGLRALEVSAAGAWLALAGVFALTAILWSLRRQGARGALFAWGYFCVALAPVLGFAEVGFMKYSPVSNHYAHLAMAGVAAAVGAALASVRVSWLARAALIAACVALAWPQVRIYTDAERLYRDTVARNPASALASNNLGALLITQGKFDAALPVLEQAVQASPHSAKAHDNLGVALYQLGRSGEAMARYREALRLEPDYFPAHNNLGAALARSGRLREAVEEFRACLRINPDYANARANLERAERMLR